MEIKLPAEGRGSWPGAVILFIGSLVLAWSATLPVATYRLTYYKTASSFDQPAGPTTLVSVERYLPSLDRAVLVISAAFIVVAVVLTVFLALPKAAVALGAAIVGVGAFIAARHPAMDAEATRRAALSFGIGTLPTFEASVGANARTMFVASLLLGVGAILLVISDRRMGVRLSRAALIVVPSLALAAVVAQAGPGVPNDRAITARFETTATEYQLLFAAADVSKVCATEHSCAGANAIKMQAHANLAPSTESGTLHYVDGVLPSADTDNFSISTSVSPPSASQEGQSAQVGLAERSASGVCLELVVRTPTSNDYGFGTTGGPCTGQAALSSAVANDRVTGGWVVISDNGRSWPDLFYNFAGPQVLVGS